MNRLQIEQDRLYPAATDPGPGAGAVRVLVLQLAQPSGWEALAPAWQGVQSDLELARPAIAVSGVDGLQLWFSLAAPVPQDSGAAFLEGLRARYLADVDPARVRMISQAQGLPRVPPVEMGPERWSAFVTPDLAAVFEETPWLDVLPTEDGQANLLRGLEPIEPAAFEAALERLRPAAAEPAPAPLQAPRAGHRDPASFLLGVMNDESAPLALRIEAAKALLPRGGGS